MRWARLFYISFLMWCDMIWYDMIWYDMILYICYLQWHQFAYPRISLTEGVLTPLRRALGRTELNIYLPDELVLIACRHRTDSMQPVKNSVLGRTCVWDPYFFLRRTERPDRMGTNEVLFNGDFDITVSGGGHILRTTHCCCAVACAKRYLSYWFWLARPKILDGPRTRFFIQGRNERPWKASFRSFRFHKVE